MNVGPEGRREGGSIFSLQAWKAAQENVFEGYLFRCERAQGRHGRVLHMAFWGLD